MTKTFTSVVLLIVVAATTQAEALKPCDLMKMLMSTDPATVERGMNGFVAMGEKAVIPLICFVGGKAAGAATPDEAAKRRGEQTLVKLGAVAVPGLIEALGTKDPGHRARLVRVLSKIQDSRREAPLMRLWEQETNDVVRASLVSAIVSVQSNRSEALGLLRQRITVAGPRELQALAVQLAMHGTTADLSQVLSRVEPGRRKSFLGIAIRELRRIGGPSARRGISRLEAFK